MTDAADLVGTAWRWHRKSYMKHVAENYYSAAAVEISEMKNVHERFLNLRPLPGVIDGDEASVLLGDTPADISVVVSKSFFRLLCIKFAPNAFCRFSSALVKNFLVTRTKWAECINSSPDTGVFVAGPTSPS